MCIFSVNLWSFSFSPCMASSFFFSLLHLLFFSIIPINSTINSTLFKVLYLLLVGLHVFISLPLSGALALFQLICWISFTCNFLVATIVSLCIEDSCLVEIVLYVCVVCFWCLGSIAIFEGFLRQDYKSRILIKRE